VWSNADNMQFVPWGEDAFAGFDPIQTTQATIIDWDRDTDLDIVLPAYAERPAGILENLRHGRMRWLPFEASFGPVNQSARIQLIDADSNASWDLLGASPSGIHLALTQTPTQNKVLHASDIQVADFAANKMLLCDYDNDGLKDLLAYNDEQLQVWRNLSNGNFAPADELFTETFPDITSIKTADLDQDGDLDWVIAQPTGVTILDNQGGNQHHWIDITLLAQQVKASAAEESGRVNQYGIGSLLELQQGASYQPRMVESPITHFGIGKHEQADVLRILWTNGIPHSLIQPQGNQLITEQQTLKGSCPYLYAWDGEQFTFVTDLLWAAPIGLQTANAEIMPDRPWEYLKISGDQLKPIDGQYRLQITEELWEAAYFDQVELIAVDHPGDVDIFTNEKVGPPFLAAHEIHTVKHPQLPVAAQDTFGQDILELLSEQDDQYVRAFHQKIRQGYTEPHFIELDLGDLSDAKKITLFLTGWIYPTDTSINVQLSQNSQLPGPRPPFITTPDAEGNWVETRGFMGFPGGKTKTIAVNISDVFAANDYRIRINTSSEIHWDAAFFTVDESAAKTVEHTAPLLSADLHTRGVSAPIIHPQYGPERYDYNQVITTPAWPAMQGNFTRFGDVTEVIRNADDQLVVISTGDEITLTFAAPNTPVPAGWKRDFVLHNIGWDKDADLNTINGQTVEPLPFRKMTAYPPPPFEQVLSLAYQRYLEIYQTRKQNHSRFQNAIRYHQYID
ncbi:MAG: CRTAC1 family protein, partial [Pirellulales bacterium]